MVAGTRRVTQLNPLSSEQVRSVTKLASGLMSTVAAAHTAIPTATTRPKTRMGRRERADIGLDPSSRANAETLPPRWPPWYTTPYRKRSVLPDGGALKEGS